ncbi:MAG: Lysophospholipid acyltransferase 1 [Trizodia sp. TS-e1964]|nr:MAG: Lysophospholipid acyltransferase 1 [Trizodia sp. TS-e1964]
MVLVMKLSAFCWNIHDGRLPPSELTDFQIERALSSIPPILDYAGYVLFFPALFAGPAFDYVEYRRWLDTSMFELPPGSDPLKKPPTRKKRKIPQSSFPALLKAGAGVFWIVLFLNFSACYPREALTSPSYMTYSFPRRVLILHMFGFSTRLKYYAVWSLTEGACILSGLGYNGLDPQSGTVRWNRLQNVDPWRIETAQNSRAYLEGWNQNTNYWLRSYVYLRVTPKGKKPGFRASLATFMTSAFWHGFYPGYYLAFGLAAFIQTVAKQFRRHVRPFFLAPDGSGTSLKPAYDIFGYLATQLGFSFTVAPFILLDFRSCILVWWRVYFYAVVGVAVTMAVFASPVKPWLAKQLQSHNKRPGLVSQASQESGPVGWIPDDPAGKLDEAVQEMVLEMEARQRKGKGVVPASLSKDN